MRAVAGALLVLSAAVVLAAVRVATRLPGPTGPDDATFNALLALGGLGLAVVGLVTVGRGLAHDRPSADRLTR